MAQKTVKLQLPFQVLLDFANGLSLQDKRQLWEWLGEQIAQAEEMLWEQEATVQAEIREARVAYESGDYVTLDDYLANPQENA